MYADNFSQLFIGHFDKNSSKCLHFSQTTPCWSNWNLLFLFLLLMTKPQETKLRSCCFIQMRLFLRLMSSFLAFRAAPKQLTYKWWFLTWWRMQISRNSAWDTWARERRLSIDASTPSFMPSTVERAQAALLPDVRRWRESSSIRELVNARRRIFEDVQFALNSCRCAFIIRNSVVRAFAMFRFAGSWNGSFKLLMNRKLNSKASRGENLSLHYVVNNSSWFFQLKARFSICDSSDHQRPAALFVTKRTAER